MLASKEKMEVSALTYQAQLVVVLHALLANEPQAIRNQGCTACLVK
jgi:hypothetical protein